MTGLVSKAMTSPCGKIRIPLNESRDDKSQIEEFLERYNGEGIQHIALGTGDIYKTVEALRARDVPFQDTPDTYYDILASLADELDIWETIYLHVLEGNNPVAEWARGTVLKPLLDAIADDSERQAFFDDYSVRVQAAYPRRDDGKTLFPFRRLFIIARV